MKGSDFHKLENMWKKSYDCVGNFYFLSYLEKSFNTFLRLSRRYLIFRYRWFRISTPNSSVTNDIENYSQKFCSIR